MVVLALDPSIRATGYTIIDDGEPVESGCIKTEDKSNGTKGEDRMRRLEMISDRLLSVIERWTDCMKSLSELIIVSELPTGSQSASAAKTLGLVSGLVKGIADTLMVPVYFYNGLSCKISVFDTRSVSKEEAIEAMKEQWPDVRWKDVKYRDEAIADSLVVYQTALNEGDIS